MYSFSHFASLNFLSMFGSESGQMCAIKEVRVVSDDQTSKESLKQLNQVKVCLILFNYIICIISVGFHFLVSFYLLILKLVACCTFDCLVF